MGIPRYIIALLIWSLVASCGGGGGGSAAPAAPTFTYTANTNQATLRNAAEVREIALEPVASLSLSRLLFDSLHLPGEPSQYQSQTIAGASGGNARLTVGGNYFIFDFDNFANGDEFINGRLVQRLPDGDIDVALDFHSLTFGTSTEQYTITGSIGRNQLGSGDRILLVNLLLDDVINNRTAWLDNWRIAERFDGLLYADVSGRMYFDWLGYVDIRTDDEVTFSDNYGLGPSAGPLIARDSQSEVHIHAINHLYVGVAWDRDDDGQLDIGGRLGLFNAVNQELTPGAEPPVANPGYEQTTAPGQPVTLSALASYGTERELLRYEWTLVGTPAGSAAQLTHSEGPFVELNPDKQGEYLVAVKVSDSGGTAHASVIVKAYDNWAPSYAYQRQLKMAPDWTPPYAVGEIVRLDATPSYCGTISCAPRYAWRVEQPSPPPGIPPEQAGEKIEFVANEQGFYQYQLIGRNFGGYEELSREVAVGTDFRFHETFYIDTGSRDTDAVTGDFNGDGLIDWAANSFLPGSSTYEYHLSALVAFSPGRFGPATRFTGDNLLLATGDITGDGRDEVIATTYAGVKILSLPSGTSTFIESNLSVSRSVDCDERRPTQPLVGDVTGDGRNDLVRFDPCMNVISVWPQNESGDLGARVDTAFSNPSLGGEPWGALGDVTGDGHADFIFSLNEGAAVLSGQEDGMFAQAAVIPYEFQRRLHLRIGDITNDGLDDIVIDYLGDWLVVPQLASGGLGAPYKIYPPEDVRPLLGRFALGDINNDGLTDIVMDGGNRWFYAIGQKDGTFEYIRAYSQLFDLVEVVDLNGDGFADMFSSEAELRLGRP